MIEWLWLLKTARQRPRGQIMRDMLSAPGWEWCLGVAARWPPLDCWKGMKLQGSRAETRKATTTTTIRICPKRDFDLCSSFCVLLYWIAVQVFVSARLTHSKGERNNWEGIQRQRLRQSIESAHLWVLPTLLLNESSILERRFLWHAAFHC